MGETNMKTNEEVYEEAKAFQKKLLNAVGVSTDADALAKDSMAMIKESGDWECFCCDYEEPVTLGNSLNACLRRIKYIYQQELFEQSMRSFYGLFVSSSLWGMYSVYHDYVSIDDDFKKLVDYDEEKVNAFYEELKNYKIEDGARLLPDYVQYLIALGEWSYEIEDEIDVYDFFKKWTEKGYITRERDGLKVPKTDKIKINREADLQLFDLVTLHPSRLNEEQYYEYTEGLAAVIPNYECYVKEPKLLSPRLNPEGGVYYITVPSQEYTVVICYRLEGDIVKILTGFKVAKELNLKIE